MAKQLRIAGTEGQRIPAITKVAEEYADLLEERMETQVKENAARVELIRVMKENKVTTYIDADRSPRLEFSIKKIDAKTKVRVRKLKDDEGVDDEEEESGEQPN